jgi:hypothetical protein
MTEALVMWVIYNSPLDFPGLYVARKWEIHPGNPVATTEYINATSLDILRSQLPHGLMRMLRNEGDGPRIVEIWL